MHFAAPLYLLLLAILPLVALSLAIRERRRSRDLAAFGELPLLARTSALPERRRRAARHALALGALALLLLTLARPQFGEGATQTARVSRDVLFVLDVSRSMSAGDAAPTRLQAATRAVHRIVEASPGDRFGIAVFAGSAFLQLPPTMDRVALETALEEADPAAMPDPGTDLAAALATTAAAFRGDREPRHHAVVLLSDGENLEGDPEEAIRALERGGIRVFTVGVGTPRGAPIPESDGGRVTGPHTDAAGRPVVTRLEDATLRRIAAETGGTYVRLDGGGGIGRLMAALSRVERREVSSRGFARLPDRYQWPLGVAILAMIAESLLADRRRGSAR